MRTYKTQHAYYRSVDLHARSLFVNVCDVRAFRVVGGAKTHRTTKRRGSCIIFSFAPVGFFGVIAISVLEKPAIAARLRWSGLLLPNRC